MKTIRIVIMILFVSATGVPFDAYGAGAAEVGDADKGLLLAKQWCASCHLVAADQASTVQTMAPPFAVVAKGMDAARQEQLRTWLTVPHAAMPDLKLSRQDIADLLAYLQRLAAH